MIDFLDNFWKMIINFQGLLLIVFITLVYIVLLINKIRYETKIFKLDLTKLEDKKNRRVAGVKTKMYENGTMRYATKIAKGAIEAEKADADEEILRRKSKYRYDMINSIVTVITQAFKR